MFRKYALGAVALLVILVALFSGVRMATAQDVIKIGIFGPMSIPGYSHWVSGMWTAAEMLKEQINGAGGWNIGGINYTLEMYYADEYTQDPYNTAGIENSIDYLCVDVGVNFIVGGFRNECVHYAIDYWHEKGYSETVPFLINGAQENTLLTYTVGADHQGYRHLYRVMPTNFSANAYTLFAAIKTYLCAENGILTKFFGQWLWPGGPKQVKTVVFVEDLTWADLLWYVMINSTFSQILFGPHVNVTGPPISRRLPDGVTHPANYQDFRDAVFAANASGCHLALIAFSGPAGKWIQQAVNELQADMLVVGIDFSAQSQTAWGSGEVEYESPVMTMGTRSPITPALVQFWDDFIAWSGAHGLGSDNWPVYTAIGVANALTVIKTAAQAVGSLDIEAIHDYLCPLENTIVQPVQVLNGLAKFTEWHDVFCNEIGSTWTQGYVRPVICQWLDGRLEVVYPIDQPYSKTWCLPPWMKRCDVNHDWVVDFADLLKVENACGAMPGDPIWDPSCDINGDGYVGADDLVQVYRCMELFEDAAVTNVTVSEMMVSQGCSVDVNVTVENRGYYTQTFNVTLYADMIVVNQTRVTLASGNSTTLTFTWDTTGFAAGNYTIKAVADTLTTPRFIIIVENETDNNVYINGAVCIMENIAAVVDVAIIQVTPLENMVGYGETLMVNVTVENQGETFVSFDVKLYANTSIINQTNVFNLPPQSSIVLPFMWNTNGWLPGSYVLTAEASVLAWETDIEDNVLTDGTVTLLLPSTETYLMISPSIDRVTLGDSLTVDVNVFNVEDLYGYDIIIKYNTSLLTANKIEEGAFLKSAGETVIFANIIDNNEGYVRFAASLLGAPHGANGNGTLFTINFTASLQRIGVSDLTFTYTPLVNHNVQPIPCYAINGQVAVIEIDVKACTVVKNETTYEIVTASNSTIHSLSYDENEYKIDLDVSGASGMLGFCNITIPKTLLSDPIAVLVNGNPVAYTKIENETHITLTFTFHNSQSTIQIISTVLGDLNGDRIVDIYDVVIVAAAYDSEPGNPRWNPLADIIQDNVIDIFDAVAVCANYGNTWQPPA